MTKRALILGAGQDASYLCDILLEKGYEVHLLHRRSSVDNLTRIAHCRERIALHRGDVCDLLSVVRAIDASQPHEIYNEADQDSVGWSKTASDYQLDVTFCSAFRLLEYVHKYQLPTRIFQPLSAHMFGDPSTLTAPAPQDEATPLNPQSPYAIAKAAAWHCCKYYRQLGVHVSCGILFNHDSPRRSEHYLLHKITKSAVRIARGQQRTVALGNLDARVDVGFAGDYMEAAWLVLQQERPDDYCIGTGVAWTVRQMLLEALLSTGTTYWDNSNVDRLVTRDAEHWQEAPPSHFQADTSKIEELGWTADTTVRQLIAMLVKHFQEQP